MNIYSVLIDDDVLKNTMDGWNDLMRWIMDGNIMMSLLLLN